MNNKAFKFIGKLSKNSKGVSKIASKGNLITACIETGIDLIDMTASIITYSSECKRTQMLGDNIYESQIMMDLFVENESKQASLEVERTHKLAIHGLGKLKLELKHEYEEFRMQLELHLQNMNKDVEFERKHASISKKVRVHVHDVIEMSTETLIILNKNTIKNKIQIAQLEEQLRISTTQYSKLLENYF